MQDITKEKREKFKKTKDAKNITKREIITEKQLQEELKKCAEKVLEPWLEENTLNYASLILVSMEIVEDYTRTTKGLGSADKLQKAIELIPKIIDIAVDHDKLTKEEGEELKNRVETGRNIVEQIIEAYIVISKNPQFLQLQEDIGEFVEETYNKCCGVKKPAKK